MGKYTMQETRSQGVAPPASVAVDDPGRQYRPRSLDDLYPELGDEERERRLRGLMARFWSKVDKSGGPNVCWFWTGGLYGNGYGALAYRNQHSLSAHRLAYIIEHGSIPEGASILHDCGDGENKSCVNPAHLRPGGDSENMLDAVRFGTHVHRIKLYADEWDEIQEKYAAGGVSYRELAEEYGVSGTTIGNIVNGRRGRPKGKVGTHPTARGEESPSSQLTEEQVREIRARHTAFHETLAGEYGVSVSIVKAIVARRTWRHLEDANPGRDGVGEVV